jgi:fumarate reductase iron-sulfur subunit
MSEDVTLEILRYRPEVDSEPHFQTYTIPYRDDWVVLDALNHIKDCVDGTLSYRWSCHMAICGSCGMMINGEPKLACHAFLRDYQAGANRGRRQSGRYRQPRKPAASLGQSEQAG